MKFICNNRVEFSAIAITETWLNETSAQLYQLNGYTFYSACRSNGKTGGGVGIYANKKYNVSSSVEYSIFNDNFESIFLRVSDKLYTNKTNTSYVTLGCIYRPPNKDPKLFLKDLKAVLADFESRNRKDICFLAGDYNLDIMDVDSDLIVNDFVNYVFILLFSYY